MTSADKKISKLLQMYVLKNMYKSRNGNMRPRYPYNIASLAVCSHIVCPYSTVS